MMCSRYRNGDRMHAILNGEPLEEVDCFKYLGSQVAADGGCKRDVVHRINGYRAWGVVPVMTKLADARADTTDDKVADARADINILS